MGGCCGKSRKEKRALASFSDGKIPIFWILGGPGSGKGTQCILLAKKYELVHLSSGDLLRAEVASESEMGKKLNSMMSTGQLVPREIVLDLLKAAMVKNFDGAKGYLIDGYPREVIQGKEFEEKIGPVTQIIYFECSDEAMTKRILKRGEEAGRVDDNATTVANRIKLFHEISEPVIQEYAEKVIKIQSERSPDEVFKTVCEKLEPFLTVE